MRATPRRMSDRRLPSSGLTRILHEATIRSSRIDCSRNERQAILEACHRKVDTVFMAKTNKRGMGRPKGYLVGDNLISLRVTQELRDGLERLADADGRSLANYLRMLFEREVKKGARKS